MSIKQDLATFLLNELNTNNLGVKFVLGKLGQTQNSTFVIERFGDPDTNPEENWYEVIREDFIPVVANTFDAVYLFDNQFKQQTIVGRFSFLVKQPEQDTVVPIIESFVDSLVGFNTVIGDNSVFFEPQGLEFIQTLVLNDIKFLEFEFPVNIRLAEATVFGRAFSVSIKKPNENTYTPLNIISYDPVKVQQTLPVQLINTNVTKSVIQTSSWVASLRFYVRTSAYYDSLVVESLMDLLEDENVLSNTIYNLRVYNPITEREYDKDVVITSLAIVVRNPELLTMTISVEQANREVI